MGGPFHPELTETGSLPVVTNLSRDSEGRIWMHLPGLNSLNLTSLYARAHYGTDHLIGWLREQYAGVRSTPPDCSQLTMLEYRFIMDALAQFKGQDVEMMMAEALIYKINARMNRGNVH